MGKTLISEVRITTPEFRLAFPAVHEASQVQGKGAFKFRITMLFQDALWNSELVPLRDLVKDLITKKFGAGVQPPKGFYIPFKDGNLSISKKTGDPYDGFANTKVVNAASDYKRNVVDGGNAAKGIKPQEIIDPSEIYAGCYCRASVNAYLWDSYEGGVSIGYLALQKTRDGKPFSAFADASEDFEPITPELTDTNKEELFEPNGIAGEETFKSDTIRSREGAGEPNLLDQL